MKALLVVNVIFAFVVTTVVVVLALDWTAVKPNPTVKDPQLTKVFIECVKRAEKAEAQAAAYREALEKILAATNDPWGWNKSSIAWICNEALGNHKP